jgi:hypothetical protein
MSSKKGSTKSASSIPTAHPVGAHFYCHLPNSTIYHAVTIVDRRIQSWVNPLSHKKKSVSDYNYYIHYDNLNSRMDKWVEHSQLIKDKPSARYKQSQANKSADRSNNPANFNNSSDSMEDDVVINKKSPGKSKRPAEDNETDETNDVAVSKPAQPAQNSSKKRKFSETRGQSAQKGNVSREEKAKESKSDGDHVDISHSEFHVGDSNIKYEKVQKNKNIERVEIGNFELNAWYYSPYPHNYHVEKLFICNKCLKYTRSRSKLQKHAQNCRQNTPPGKKIYSSADNSTVVYELDGEKAKLYCQCLCLFAKLFIDHKTMYYDVAPFMFYVLLQRDSNNSLQLAAYFSKEKAPSDNNNLACILTFPQHQKLGFGKFLIALSYELSRREGKIGGPERPLSDLGRLSYHSYWKLIILQQLIGLEEQNVSAKELSQLTCIDRRDIINICTQLDVMSVNHGEENSSAASDSEGNSNNHTSSHIIYVDKKRSKEFRAILDAETAKQGKTQHIQFSPALLKWSPPTKASKSSSNALSSSYSTNPSPIRARFQSKLQFKPAPPKSASKIRASATKNHSGDATQRLNSIRSGALSPEEMSSNAIAVEANGPSEGNTGPASPPSMFKGLGKGWKKGLSKENLTEALRINREISSGKTPNINTPQKGSSNKESGRKSATTKGKRRRKIS